MLQKVGKQPDFKQKNGEGALWIDNRQTPEWVLQNMQQLPGGIPYTPPAGGSSSRASSQPAAQMDFLPSAPSSEKEAAWVDVFTNYRGWWDNRMNVSPYTSQALPCALPDKVLSWLLSTVLGACSEIRIRITANQT